MKSFKNISKTTRSKKLVSLLTALAFLVVQTGFVYGEIMPHNSVPVNKPTVRTQQNYPNVPVVDIVNPNSQGTSHNKFDVFNVGNEGAILNNSKNGATSVILGENVSGNTNLLEQEAKIILNEVVAANKSNLEGQLEIVGQKADFILANPYGISVNGGSFINVGKISLITGAVNVDNNGLINKYEINKINGVEIGEKGMKAPENAVELISRYTKISGQLKAKTIDIKAGNKEYDPNTGKVISEVIEDENNANKTAVSIEVSAESFGSMYGDRITIVATEEGFGVKTAQGTNLISDIESIEIRSQGSVDIKGNIRANNVESVSDMKVIIEAKEWISTSGDIEAKHSVIMGAGYLMEDEVNSDEIIRIDGNITNTGNIKSQEGDVEIRAGEAFINKDGKIIAQKKVIIEAKDFRNENTNYLKEGAIRGQNIEIKAHSVVNVGSDIEAVEKVDIKAQEIRNEAIEKGAQSFEDIKTISTRRNPTQDHAQDLAYQEAEIIHTARAATIIGQDIEITAEEIANISSKIEAQGDLNIRAKNLINTAIMEGVNLATQKGTYVKYRERKWYSPWDWFMETKTVTYRPTFQEQYTLISKTVGEIIGNNVKIELEEKFIQDENSGAIVRGKELGNDLYSQVRGINVEIIAKEIENYGSLEGVLRLELAAENISIINGYVKGKEINIQAQEDFIAKKAVKRFSGAASAISYTRDNIDQYGKIEAGDSLTIKAKNITISALNIKTNKGELNAQEILKLEGITYVVDANSVRAHSQGGDSYREEVEKGTMITGKAGLYMKAGNGEVDELFINEARRGTAVVGGWILQQGYDIIGSGDIAYDAEDVMIMSMETRKEESYFHKMEGGTFGKNSTEEARRVEVTNIPTNIITDGQITINAGKNIVIQGGNLESTEEGIVLKAETDIYILSAQDSEYSDYSKEVKGFLGLTGEQTKQIDSKTKTVASTIKSAKDLGMIAGNDLMILGSDIETVGNAYLEAGNDVSILNAEESEYHYYYHEKQTFDLMGSLKAIADSFNIADRAKEIKEKGSLTVTLAKAEKNSHEETESITTARESTLDIGGNLSIQSGKDAKIVGSQLIADNIDIGAENIYVLSAKESYELSVVDKESSLTISVGITNAAMEAVKALNTSVEVGKELDGYKKALNDIKVLQAAGKATAEAVKEIEDKIELLKAYYAVATANAAISAVSAAASAKTAGFNVSATIAAHTKETSHTESDQTNKGSLLVARSGDINLTATQDINQVGSEVRSLQGDISYEAGNDITIEASRNERTTEDKNKSYDASYTYGTGGMSASIGFSVGGDKSKDITYSNSIVGADNGKVTFKTGINKEENEDVIGNMTISGGNVYAKEVEMDIAGNLKIESLQDTHEKKGSQTGMNLGVSWGRGIDLKSKTGALIGSRMAVPGKGGLHGVSAEVNYGKIDEDKAWVAKQSGIIGENNVYVKVEDNTHLKGSILESKSGELLLDTGSLTYEDVKDKNNSSNVNFNMNVSLDIDYLKEKGTTSSKYISKYLGKRESDKDANKKTDEKEKDSSVTKWVNKITPTFVENAYDFSKNISDSVKNTISNWGYNVLDYANLTNIPISTEFKIAESIKLSYTNKEQKKEQLNRATIGEGKIIVGGKEAESIEGLNRDVNKAQEITKDETSRDTNINYPNIFRSKL